MKLEDLKNKLQQKLNIEVNNTSSKTNQMKIIGVTGSCGKSTVCYLLHEYLKKLGFKSVLYSSIKVDSPMSINSQTEAAELSFKNETELLDIITSALEYKSDYLILEINESIIEKGLIKDIPFDIRVLTNLNPKHNLKYSATQYVNIKKSFFKDVKEACICIYGFQDYDKELFNELLTINNMPKLTFTSNYIARKKDINPNTISTLLTHIDEETKEFEVKMNNTNYKFNYTSNMKYNILNYLCVLTILQSINQINENVFNKVINSTLPGRSETYYVDGRTIIVDLHLSSALQELKELKAQGKIENIKVVVGSVGSGFYNWSKEFNEGFHYTNRHASRKYAMELLKDGVSYIYLTENDNGKENVRDICNELQSYLGTTPSTIIENREEAIRRAISESSSNDAILIAGRGNRRILCNGEFTMKLLKDSDIVKKTLNELGW